MFDRLFKFFFPSSSQNPPKFQALILEPILTPSAIVEVEDLFDSDAADGNIFAGLGDDLDDIPFAPPQSASLAFESGYFIVGEGGEVGIDFLFDSGKYKFELAIFSLEDLDEIPGSEEFIREAARRALTNTTEGYTVIRDRLEGARFDGDLGEGKDWNTGDYSGVKTFKMEAGTQFGMMLVPNGTLEDVYENPNIGGSKAPLFSLATANPDDTLHLTQIADVTGEGNTFAMEDVQQGHRWFDGDYNDLIFQVRGATGEAVYLDDLVEAGEDWRETDMGEAIANYAHDAIADEPALPDALEEQQPLIGVIDEGEFSAEESDSLTETLRDRLNLGRDRIDGDDSPLLPTGEEAETDILEAIENETAPLWVGRADGETWGESLVEFVEQARGSGRDNAIAHLALDNLLGEALGESEQAALTYARDNGVLVVIGGAGEEWGAGWEEAIAQHDNIVTVGAVEKGEIEAAELAGQFSQVWAVNPELSHTQVIEILEQTATARNPETGAAIIDVVAAGYLAAATTPEPNKRSLQPFPDAPDNPETDWQGWESGVFTVGETGEVAIDTLYDGGSYEGEMAIFDVAGLEAFQPGSPAFIAEVTRRILAGEGGIVFSDKGEGARFASEENEGSYGGVQTVAMNPGTEFAIALIPNGTIAELAENPALGLAKQPLFSLFPVNPVDGFNGGYLADVTGEGKVFAFEENRNLQDVREYGDLLFTLGGATGIAPLLEEVAPVGDWQNTHFGEIFKNAVSFIPGEGAIADSLSRRVRMALQRSQNLDNYDPAALAQTREWVVGIAPGQSPTQLAELFGAKYLKATGYIPNTYVWEFPETMTPEEIAHKLNGFTGVEFSYPLVPIAIDYHNDPLVADGTQWHLRSGDAIDANVTKAWETAKGEGVVVGIVDDGFNYNHEELNGDKYRSDLSRNFEETTANGTYDTDPDVAISSTHTYTGIGGIWGEETNYIPLEVKGLKTSKIQDVTLDLTFNHAFAKDLQAFLISPEGERVSLDDPAVLDAFDGQNPEGMWVLEVEDPSAEGGAIADWSLTFDTLQTHGTKVAGVAVARGDNGIGGSGVAPEAAWAGLQLGSRVTDLNIADSLSYLSNDIDIYNNSWGLNGFAGLTPMIEYAIAAGANSGRDGLGNIYVFAAGNSGGDSLGSHANDDNLANSRQTIAVAAVNGEGVRSDYSEIGASLLVSAYSSDRLTFDGDSLTIPADSSQTVYSEITVPEENEAVNDVTATIFLNPDYHDNLNDLSVALVGPSDEEVLLFAGAQFSKSAKELANPSRYGYPIPLTFSDRATRVLGAGENPFQGQVLPQNGSLSQLAQNGVAGAWKLKVWNNTTGEETFLDGWQLSLDTNKITTTGADGNNYTSDFGGTSAAAPFVSGVVALMLEANPTLTWRDVQHILIETSQPEEGKLENLNDPNSLDPDTSELKWKQNGAGYWVNHDYGFGVVNAEAAVNLAKDWTSVGKEVSVTKDRPQLKRITETGNYSDVSVDINSVEDDMTIEWVEVAFKTDHPLPGLLDVVLEHRYEDANGELVITESVLNKPNSSGVRADSENPFRWSFTSARHWGEPSYGTWRLKVKDKLYRGTNSSWGDWAIDLYGTKPTVSIEATDSEATEGEDSGEFTIYRTGNVEKDLVVNYEILPHGRTAKNGEDYETLSSSVVIPSGFSDTVIPIKPLDDEIEEYTESVTLNLTEGSDYELSKINSDYVVIRDNETPHVFVYSELHNGVSDINYWSRENYISESGNNGYFVFNRIGDFSEDLTVNVELTGTATNGDDYNLPTSFTIPAGRLSFTAPITPIDDSILEKNEIIQLDILPSSEYKIVNDRGSQTAVIWDNDNRPTVTIEATDDTASEYGDPGEFTITRTGDITQPLTVDYWIFPYFPPRTKNDDTDFEKIPEKITIPVGESSVKIPIIPKDDNLIELDELIQIFILKNEKYVIGKQETSLIKISDNDTPQSKWKTQLGTPEYDRANSIAFDSDNNVYITGRTSGDLDGTNKGVNDSFIAKYNSSGGEQWKVQLGTEGYDEASGIIVDRENNIYVTGWTDGTMDGTGTERDAWIAKYNSDGGFIWKRELENSNSDYANNLTVDNSGNVYITGQTSGEAKIWFAKYDSNGNLLKHQLLGTPLADEAHDITVDNEGNIYLTGQTQGELGDKIYSEGDLWQDHQGDDFDAWIAKYDRSGEQKWLKRLGTMTEDTAHSISVSETGNIYLSGQTRGWFGDIYKGDRSTWTGDPRATWGGLGDLGGTYYGETDAWVAQLDADGNLNWKRQLGTEASDRATSVVADSNGNVYLAGNSRGKMDDATHFGKEDAWIAKYDIDGALQWRQQYGTTADDVVADIALAGDGIYLTGYTAGKLGDIHFGKEDAWVMKLA